MHEIVSNRKLVEILKNVKCIAVVGLSPKESRPSNMVARYLQQNGYKVVPVNPGQTEILGEPCYGTLKDIPFAVDLVDIFRKAEAVPAIVDDAIEIGARYVWMQLGITHTEAAEKAESLGIEVIMDRCIKVDHQTLKSEL